MTPTDAIALYRATKAARTTMRRPTDITPMTKRQLSTARAMLDGWAEHRRGRNGNTMRTRNASRRSPHA
jgi:hypothetical protein